MGTEIKCLDHGFVRLVDSMGTDESIVQAARVSYGSGTKTVREDRALIRYLMRHRHTSPFEMCEIKVHAKMPIFVARQWVRHRTACLSGDTNLIFDLPKGAKNNNYSAFPKTIKEFYDLWHYGIVQEKNNLHKKIDLSLIEDNKEYSIPELCKIIDRKEASMYEAIRNGSLKYIIVNNKKHVVGKQVKLWANKKHTHKINMRSRLKNMKLRSYDEKSGKIYHTKVKDIWSNGLKEVWSIKVGNNTIISTLDHMYFTDCGWQKLSDILRNNYSIAVSSPIAKNNFKYPKFSKEDIKNEIWKPVIGYGGRYQVSNIGRILHTKYGHKNPTKVDNHLAVSLSKNGESKLFYVHRLVLDAFVSKRPQNSECRHLDGNGANNRVDNLIWGSAKENSQDRIDHGASTKLGIVFKKAEDPYPCGTEEVFDIEVEGPYHNFLANNIVVHNSVNEYSGRYSEMKNEFYKPYKWKKQSQNNKQGSEEELENIINFGICIDYAEFNKSAFKLYNTYLETEVSREQARIVLPLSTYTEWYWKIDLHNLFHFLKLRLDPHAQYEIRVYAEAIAKITKELFPIAYEAFEDYILNAITLSKQEQEWLHEFSESLQSDVQLLPEKTREEREFKEKLQIIFNTNR